MFTFTERGNKYFMRNLANLSGYFHPNVIAASSESSCLICF